MYWGCRSNILVFLIKEHWHHHLGVAVAHDSREPIKRLAVWFLNHPVTFFFFFFPFHRSCQPTDNQVEGSHLLSRRWHPAKPSISFITPKPSLHGCNALPNLAVSGYWNRSLLCSCSRHECQRISLCISEKPVSSTKDQYLILWE